MNRPQAVAEVAEPLPAAALIAVVGQRRAQHVDQLVTGDVLGEHVVEADPYRFPAELDVVVLLAPPDEADLGGVRAGAAVGAARHPDVGVEPTKPSRVEFAFQLIEDAG